MITFLLVPGAWLGAWCWDGVVTRLRDAGRSAVALTLTGLGERSHLLMPEVGLHSHVRDVVALLRDRDLRNVVPVGHSYGGTVITAAAEEVPERLLCLAYLDGALPRDGESTLDVVGADIATRLRDGATRAGDGWRVPPPCVADWGLPEGLHEPVQRRLTPHPLRSLAEPVRLRSPAAAALDRFYLRSSRESPLYGRLMARARRAGWPCKDLPGGHYAMLTAPEAVAASLIELTSDYEGGKCGDSPG